MCSNKNIVWIVGHRVDERYKFVEGEEKGIYLPNKLRYEKNNPFYFLFDFPFLALSQIEDPTSWSFYVNDLGNGKYELSANVQIEDGWHIYSQYKNPESFIVSTSFLF